MKQFTILILIAVFSNVSEFHAQQFTPFFALGTNITSAYQTEKGTSQVGTRMGINIGPGVSVLLNNRFKTSIEVLYSKNGFYVNPAQITSIDLEKISLHYAEVPLSLEYRFNISKNKTKKQLCKYYISGGLSYARLFSYKIIDLNGADITSDINLKQENNLLFNFSATYLMNKQLGLNTRVTLSKYQKFTIAFRLLYSFNKKH